MIYGFVVAAFLVINIDDRPQRIPFATVDACEKTMEQIRSYYSSLAPRHFFCVSTGADNTTAPAQDGQ